VRDPFKYLGVHMFHIAESVKVNVGEDALYPEEDDEDEE
jgi:hypothetical protein